MSKDVDLGECYLCGENVVKRSMTRHAKKCLRNYPVKGDSCSLYHLVVEGKYEPEYWLQLEIPGDAELDELDSFLRDVWLECCGHMSSFQIGQVSYLDNPLSNGGMSLIREEEGFDCEIQEKLSLKDTFFYSYDFGSTTKLKLRVVEVREGVPLKDGVVMLARNLAPSYECFKCRKPATVVRASGWGASIEDLFCEKCAKREIGEGMALPLVNSPRSGTYAYCGPSEGVVERYLPRQVEK